MRLSGSAVIARPARCRGDGRVDGHYEIGLRCRQQTTVESTHAVSHSSACHDDSGLHGFPCEMDRMFDSMTARRRDVFEVVITLYGRRPRRRVARGWRARRNPTSRSSSLNSSLTCRDQNGVDVASRFVMTLVIGKRDANQTVGRTSASTTGTLDPRRAALLCSGPSSPRRSSRMPSRRCAGTRRQ
jgi:hypothetical protein